MNYGEANEGNANRMGGVITTKELIPYIVGHYDIRWPALHLESPPGVGKTSMVHQAAARLSVTKKAPVGLTVDSVANSNESDAMGMVMPITHKDESGAEFQIMEHAWPTVVPGNHKFRKSVRTRNYVYYNGKLVSPAKWVKYCLKNGVGTMPEIGIVFLDEFPQAPLDIQALYAEFIREGVTADYSLPEGWMIVLAGNSAADRAGVKPTPMQVQNRFVHLQLEPHRESTVRHFTELGYPANALSIIEGDLWDLMTAGVPEGTGPFPTCRTYEEVIKISRKIKDSGYRDQDFMFWDNPEGGFSRMRTYADGLLGQDFVFKMLPLLQQAKDMPPIEDILRDPFGTSVPATPSAVNFSFFTLPDKVNSNTEAKKAIQYMERYAQPEQMLVFFMRLTKRTIDSQKGLARKWSVVADWRADPDNLEMLTAAYGGI